MILKNKKYKTFIGTVFKENTKILCVKDKYDYSEAPEGTVANGNALLCSALAEHESALVGRAISDLFEFDETLAKERGNVFDRVCNGESVFGRFIGKQETVRDVYRQTYGSGAEIDAVETAFSRFCEETSETPILYMAKLGQDGVIDLIAVVGYYTFVSMTLNVFQIMPPDDIPREMG